MENQYNVAYLFRENLTSYKSEKTVIYGLSNYTLDVISNCQDFNIVGLMDGYKKDGYMYGKEILSEEKVLELGVKNIVIIARSNSLQIIYRRIAEFCKCNKINIFDVLGNDLIDKADNENERDYIIPLNEKELKEEINRHEVISFDIFDTLLIRNILYPQDVIELVGMNIERDYINIDEFIRCRIEAEQELSKIKAPTLEEIYKLVSVGLQLPKDEIEYLMNMEISIEKQVLICREAVVNMLQYALNQGKKVYLVSDMYLSKVEMCRILEENKIIGYNDVIISCEYGISKQQGLFRYLKEIAKGASYLHIGDNLEADVISARIEGIDTYRIYSATEILEHSIYKEIIYKSDTLTKRLVLGKFLANIFNNPFISFDKNGRVTIESTYDMSYIFVAPVISAFVLWLIEEVKKEHVDNILFGARDGYLIHQLYMLGANSLKELNLPYGTYFYISRMVGIISAIFTEEDIIYATNIAFDDTPEMLLKYRFFLDESDILPYEKSLDIIEYVLCHKETIFRKAEVSRESYTKYIESINMDGKVAFFDFVSSGSCQMCLEKLINKSIQGYYFIRLHENYEKKKNLRINAIVENEGIFTINKNIYENYLLIERIISSLEPSLMSFDKSGNPKFVEENRTQIELEHISQCHKGITDYFIRLSSLTRGKVNSNEMFDIADLILKFYNNKYTLFDKEGLSQFIMYDEFSRREIII